MRRAIAILSGVGLLFCASAGRASILDLFSGLSPVRATPQTIQKETPPRTLLLNGFPLKVLSGRTPETIAQVLDYYADSFARAPSGKPAQPMQRQLGRDFGTLLTVDATAMETWNTARANRQHYAFTAPLRMAYARRVDGYTDYLAVWSDAPLSAALLAPKKDLDVPGRDPEDTPRPPGSVRGFNIYDPDQGYLVVSYQVPIGAAPALGSTVAALRGAGYAIDAAFQRAAQAKGRPVLRLERPGQDLIVSVQTLNERPDACSITYLSRKR